MQLVPDAIRALFPWTAAAKSRQVARRERAEVERLERSVPQDLTFFRRLGISLDSVELRDPYKQHPYVFAVVSSRARQFSQAPWRFGVEEPDGSLADLPRGAAPELTALFEQPNRAMSGPMLWSLTSLWLDLLGEAFWVLDRDTETQVPANIFPVAGGHSWKPGPLGEDRLPTGWVYTSPNGQDIPYTSEQLVYFRTPNPSSPLRGCPALAPLTVGLTADFLAANYNLEFFENGADAGGVLAYQDNLTQGEFDTIRDRWEDRHQGAGKRRRVAVLEGGAEWRPNTITQRDMEYLKLREWTRDEICAVYGWPKWAVGATDTVNHATAVEMRAQLWQETIIPALQDRARTVNAQLTSKLAGASRIVGFFDLDEVPALTELRLSRWDTAQQMLAAGVSLEEVNRLLDLGVREQDGWNEVWRSIAVQPTSFILSGGGADEPAPTDAPAEEPDEEPAEDGDSEAPGDDAEAVEEAVALIRANETTNRQRRKLSRQWNRTVITPSEEAAEREYQPYMVRYAGAQVARFNAWAAGQTLAIDAPVTKQFLSNEAIEEILNERGVWDAKLRAASRRVYSAATVLSSAFTVGELGPQAELDPLDPRLESFVRERTRRIVGINDRLREATRFELQDALANGETVTEIRQRLRVLSDKFKNPARAQRIARTEAGTVANTVRAIVAQAAGVSQWIWVTAADEAVRESHVLAEANSISQGGVTSMQEPFSNGLLYPNDPAGPPGEVINCRCTTSLLPSTDGPFGDIFTDDEGA